MALRAPQASSWEVLQKEALHTGSPPGARGLARGHGSSPAPRGLFLHFDVLGPALLSLRVPKSPRCTFTLSASTLHISSGAVESS